MRWAEGRKRRQKKEEGETEAESFLRKRERQRGEERERPSSSNWKEGGAAFSVRSGRKLKVFKSPSYLRAGGRRQGRRLCSSTYEREERGEGQEEKGEERSDVVKAKAASHSM